MRTHPAVAALRWQIVCLAGLVVAVPLTWLSTPGLGATLVTVVGWSVAIGAFLMAWAAILSERRLTPWQRRELLVQLSTKQLGRLELSTRFLFVASAAFALGGLLVALVGP